MVTDQGQLIRTPVRKVRLAGRNTQGVIVFRTSEQEHVVSVERLADADEDEDDDVTDGEAAAGGDAPEPSEG
jgi:DNA gyrase subunit A